MARQMSRGETGAGAEQKCAERPGGEGGAAGKVQRRFSWETRRPANFVKTSSSASHIPLSLFQPAL